MVLDDSAKTRRPREPRGDALWEVALDRKRVAIVTGAAGGVGLRIAQLYAAAEYQTVLVDLDHERVSRAASEVSNSAKAYAADVADEAAVKGIVKTVAADYGSIDVLVNSAGITSLPSILDETSDEWKRVLDVNLYGTYFFLREVARVMVDTGSRGCIVNISSLAGRSGGIIVSPGYSASKAGVIGLTKAAARQLAGYGVRVVCVAPGTLRTEMTESWGEETLARLAGGIPLGRVGTADDVAEMVYFLASEKAGFVTGVVVDVNGGQYIAP